MKIEDSIDNLRLKLDNIVGYVYDTTSDEYKEFCVAVEQMYYDIINKHRNIITYEEWKYECNQLNENELCPCDNHPPSLCETCRGACSCHYKKGI